MYIKCTNIIQFHIIPINWHIDNLSQNLYLYLYFKFNYIFQKTFIE